jgi:hypothetical protein
MTLAGLRNLWPRPTFEYELLSDDSYDLQTCCNVSLDGGINRFGTAL